MAPKISDEKREEIKQAVKSFERHCDQYRRDMIWDLSMRLGLEESTVEAWWDASL